MSEFVTVARRNELKPGCGKTIRLGEKSIALFAIGDEVFATNGVCPHKGGPLGEGFVENGVVYCPLHGWAFDVKTGACPENARAAVKTYPVRMVGEEIQVQLTDL
jgi:NAD(P)H-dependent nitrite reductase small subunit